MKIYVGFKNKSLTKLVHAGVIIVFSSLSNSSLVECFPARPSLLKIRSFILNSFLLPVPSGNQGRSQRATSPDVVDGCGR